MAGRFGIFSIGLFACCLIAGGTAPAAVVNILPAGLADSNQTVDISSNYNSVNLPRFCPAAGPTDSQVSSIDDGSQDYVFHMPEPSTLFLVALGLVGIVGYGLRKRIKR